MHHERSGKLKISRLRHRNVLGDNVETWGTPLGKVLV
jgi:hypothetical protein